MTQLRALSRVSSKDPRLLFFFYAHQATFALPFFPFTFAWCFLRSVFFFHRHHSRPLVARLPFLIVHRHPITWWNLTLRLPGVGEVPSWKTPWAALHSSKCILFIYFFFFFETEREREGKMSLLFHPRDVKLSWKEKKKLTTVKVEASLL